MASEYKSTHVMSISPQIWQPLHLRNPRLVCSRRDDGDGGLFCPCSDRDTPGGRRTDGTARPAREADKARLQITSRF